MALFLLITIGFAAQKQNLSDCTLASSVIDCTENNIRISKQRMNELIEKKCYDYYKTKMQENSLLLAKAQCEVDVRKTLIKSVDQYFKNLSSKE